MKQRRLPEEYRTVESTIVPDDVVARLLGSTDLPRTFSDLAVLGIPDELLRELTDLCAREGFAEQAVVEAFLAWLVDQLSSVSPALPDLRELRDRLSGVLGSRNYRALRRELRALLRRFAVAGS